MDRTSYFPGQPLQTAGNGNAELKSLLEKVLESNEVLRTNQEKIMTQMTQFEEVLKKLQGSDRSEDSQQQIKKDEQDYRQLLSYREKESSRMSALHRSMTYAQKNALKFKSEGVRGPPPATKSQFRADHYFPLVDHKAILDFQELMKTPMFVKDVSNYILYTESTINASLRPAKKLRHFFQDIAIMEYRKGIQWQTCPFMKAIFFAWKSELKDNAEKKFNNLIKGAMVLAKERIKYRQKKEALGSRKKKPGPKPQTKSTDDNSSEEEEEEEESSQGENEASEQEIDPESNIAWAEVKPELETNLFEEF